MTVTSALEDISKIAKGPALWKVTVCGLQAQRPPSLLSVVLPFFLFFLNFDMDEEVGPVFCMAALPLFKISNPVITLGSISCDKVSSHRGL